MPRPGFDPVRMSDSAIWAIDVNHHAILPVEHKSFVNCPSWTTVKIKSEIHGTSKMVLKFSTRVLECTQL